jgi:hypothetical protein
MGLYHTFSAAGMHNATTALVWGDPTAVVSEIESRKNQGWSLVGNVVQYPAYSSTYVLATMERRPRGGEEPC